MDDESIDVSEEAAAAAPAEETTGEPSYRRQAIVVIHGMGEQRPVETLNAFSAVIAGGEPFHSRPMRLGDAFDSRMHVVPRSPRTNGVRAPFDAQTDIVEYHWAHLMTGNRLDDLWPTFRKMMFPVTGAVQTAVSIALVVVLVLSSGWLLGDLPVPAGAPPWMPWALAIAAGILLLVLLLPNVPPGLIGMWFIVWLLAGALAWVLREVPAVREAAVPTVATALAGGVTSIAIVAYLVGRVLPGWLVRLFVDVVRYLDTSPRSYAVRHDIRKGIVDLLDDLQRSGRYSRIVVVAHSLGSYIAYDAISYLWTIRNDRAVLEDDDPDVRVLEEAARSLSDGWSNVRRWAIRREWEARASARRAYREAQRKVWIRARERGHPWIITDLVTFGSPMAFADRLFTRDYAEFADRVSRRELVTCPPAAETESPGEFRLMWRSRRGDSRLHEAAPFALVRWTNLWFPARWGFFGDWFGGGLARLYGPGVEDVRLDAAGLVSRIPGYAHVAYLHGVRGPAAPGSFAAAFREAMDLHSASWLPPAPAVRADASPSR